MSISYTRDGDAVHISAHIVEDLVRTGERAFGINHPLLNAEHF